MNISTDVYVLSARDLDERERRAYQRGVARGRFEAKAEMGKEQVALNCRHWDNGICNHCGAQHQGCEVDAMFKCPHFAAR